MNKEKQIEEMSNEIYETLMLEAECPLSGMDCAIIADLLIGKGYRKTSDIALEVITEFVEVLKEDKRIALDSIGLPVGMVLVDDIDYYAEQLKKKYTENGK